MIHIDLADFFELTPDLVWLAGKDGYLKKVNRAVIERLGYDEEVMYSQPITAFMYPGDVDTTLYHREKLLKGEVLQNFCNRYVTKSGEIIWLEWTSVYITDKDTVFAVAKDITARKKIEKEIEDNYQKFKGLASHFKSRIEKDRKTFAYELHEELAQLVSVINMDVGWLNLNVDHLPEKVKARVEHASAVSKLMIKTIQRLSVFISTKMLDDFGLQHTMEWLCREFSMLHRISCDFQYYCDESKISNEVKVDIFRICQDALIEVLDQGSSGSIMICIKEMDDILELSIFDSGNGFDPVQEKQKMGMVGITERAISINGSVTLHKLEEEGSGMCILLPTRNPHLVTVS
jgi:PAS domain S-box-containing protein